MPEAIDPRFTLANERTLLAWIRTGLALMAFGFVIERLAVWFGPGEPGTSETTTLVIGAVIISLGAISQILGAVRFIAVKRALVEGRTLASGALAPVFLSMIVALAGVVLLVYLLVA